MTLTRGMLATMHFESRRTTLMFAQVPASESDQADPGILRLPGHSATDGIVRLETRLAAGARFGVLVTSVNRLERHDAHLLEQWHRAASDRMEALCVGWATVVPGAAIRPAVLVADVAGAPVSVATRVYADPYAALAWLRLRLQR